MNHPAKGASVLVLTALLALTPAEAAEALRLKRLPGPAAAVQVEDALGAPVEGATVTFQLPAGASFASGMRTEMVTTDTKGRAQVGAVRWPGEQGKPQLHVSASYQGAKATLDFVVEARASEPSARPSLNKKWLILALAAGGAAGALALGGRAGSSSSAAAAAAITLPAITPTLGRPSVVVVAP